MSYNAGYTNVHEMNRMAHVGRAPAARWPRPQFHAQKTRPVQQRQALLYLRRWRRRFQRQPNTVTVVPDALTAAAGKHGAKE